MIKVEILKDRMGTMLGKILDKGSTKEVRDRNGSLLARYDKKSNKTQSKFGAMLNYGDTLTSFIFK